MNGQEFNDALNGLSKDATQLVDAIIEACKDACVGSVERAGDMAGIPYWSEEQRSNLTHRLMRLSATTDALTKHALDQLEHRAWQLVVTVDEISHKFEALWNEHGHLHREALREAKEATSMEQMKVRALEARRRDHALHSPQVRQQVWDITGGKCIYCDVELIREPNPDELCRRFEVDHIVAKTNGGPDHLSNYVPACHQCNTSKSNKSIFRFLKRNGSPDLQVVGGSEA